MAKWLIICEPVFELIGRQRLEKRATQATLEQHELTTALIGIECGTSRAPGLPALARIVSLPAPTSSRRRDRCVLAWWTLTMSLLATPCLTELARSRSKKVDQRHINGYQPAAPETLRAGSSAAASGVLKTM